MTRDPELPFGEDGGALGYGTTELLGSLCVERPGDQPGRWQTEDGVSIRQLMDIERNLWLMTELQDAPVNHLRKYVEDFHTALPFTEAERGMLFRTAGGSEDDYIPREDDEILSWLEVKEELVVSAGLRHVVRGRDLTRCWLSWRRETDEYKDQGTLDVAREALRAIIHLVTPKEPLPEAYLVLRQQPSAEAEPS
jgi:hypothetical protein